MIELVHGLEPQQLTLFRQQYPNATHADFSAQHFQAVKRIVKVQLNSEQGGLCVYCERPLDAQEGQIEHIKPKSGANAHPHLTFMYTNYAHSCLNEKTCGSKKQAGILPIEPTQQGCNDQFFLNQDGSIDPILGLTRTQKHPVIQTRDMLGLQNPDLVRDREQWIKQIQILIGIDVNLIPIFLADKPFRYILRRFVA